MGDPTSSMSDAGRLRLVIYRASDAPLLQDTDMMQYTDEGPSTADGSKGEAPDYGDRQHGAVVSVLFRQAGEGGLSLIHAWLKPGFIISRHSHNTDCLYYVVSGEAILGNQVLRAGDGFFVPASHPYAYSAGPEGAEVLEFRGATSFDITNLEKPDGWARLLASAATNRLRWLGETVPPSWRVSKVAPATDAAGRSP
jgi:quercetin dioxygenase-like cupin family protein